MDSSDLVLQLLVTERLETARAEARRRALVPRPVREPLRVRLGVALIALGQRLLHAPAPTGVTP